MMYLQTLPTESFNRKIDGDIRQRLIIPCRNESWESPLWLHDMLNFPTELEAIIKPYVADYPINVIDVSRLTEETRKRLKQFMNEDVQQIKGD